MPGDTYVVRALAGCVGTLAIVAGMATAQAAGETVLVPLTACGGVAAAYRHRGIARVRFDGVGTITPGSVVTDAFYYLSPDAPNIPIGPNAGELRVSRPGEFMGPCTCSEECAGRNESVQSLIIGPYPASNSLHRYEVELDLGADVSSEVIAFGVGDCGCDDNSGLITVTFLCQSDMDCDDGDPCSTDTCSNGGECRHRYDTVRCGINFLNLSSVAPTPDGGFVVVGGTSRAMREPPASDGAALLRFTRQGSLDARFGLGGEITLGYDASNAFQRLNAVAAQPDGKVVVVGDIGGVMFHPFTTDVDYFYYYSLLLMGRFGLDGVLDPTFARNPFVAQIGISLGGAAVLVQDDGKILTLGSRDSFAPHRGLLLRLDAGGQPDPTFGVEGMVTIDTSGPFMGRQPNGGIIVGHLDNGVGISRYDGTGTLDTLFGEDGHISTIINGSGWVAEDNYAFALLPDGGILVAGSIGGQARYPFQSDADNEWIVLQYEANGVPVEAFGEDGVVVTNLGRLNGPLSAAAVQRDGKVITAGFIDTFHGDPQRPDLPALLLMRYDQTGSLDRTFGSDGTVKTKIPDQFKRRLRLVLQPDDRIVVVAEDLIVRYGGDGGFDHSFTVTGSICGDGVVEAPSEECDEAANNGAASSCCTSSCYLRGAGETCREGRHTLCDPSEACNGIDAMCPPDVFADVQTPCAIQDPCTVKDHCEGGQCVPGTRVCGATVSQCLSRRRGTVRACPLKRSGKRKRLPRRIDVQCKVDRASLIGAEQGGSCEAVAFAATAASTSMGCASCPDDEAGIVVPSYECHALSADDRGCGDADGSAVTNMERRKLRRDGTALARLKINPSFRRALKRCRCLPVDVCTTIVLSQGARIPLACELTLASQTP